MSKARAKNIDSAALELIVGILDGWSGKLTWTLLVESIEQRTRICYTRQALDRHDRIKDAYALAKSRMGRTPRDTSRRQLSQIEISAMTERFERLRAANERLKLENERLLEKFVRWAYNAHLRGLTRDFLDSPLPGVDREPTIIGPRR